MTPVLCLLVASIVAGCLGFVAGIAASRSVVDEPPTVERRRAPRGVAPREPHMIVTDHGRAYLEDA